MIPGDIEAYKARSVLPFGPRWGDRFHACLDAAYKVINPYASAVMLDEATFSDAGKQAMGIAILEADVRYSESYQILVWDGHDTGLTAGTSADGKAWRSSGQKQIHLDLPTTLRASRKKLRQKNKDPSRSLPGPTDPRTGERVLYASLFADLVGFSVVPEDRISAMLNTVFTALKAAVKPARGLILKNSWGDSLFLVFDTVANAADCALNIQDKFHAIDLAVHTLPETLDIRIGCHIGPALLSHHPVTDRPDLFGPGVTFAARIEPSAAPGAVYVSAAFANHLALDPNKRWSTDYVGQIKPHRHPRSERIFALKRSS